MVFQGCHNTIWIVIILLDTLVRDQLDALDFVGDNLLDLALDAVVVLFNLLLHGVVAVLVGEVDNLRYLHVTSGFPLNLLVIHDNLGMENLLLDALVEIVRYRPDKHSLCQVADF